MWSSGGTHNHHQHYNKTMSPAGSQRINAKAAQSFRTFTTENKSITKIPKGVHLGINTGDEGSARVINRDNNYPNNERKTSECEDFKPTHSMESTLFITAAATQPVEVEVTELVISRSIKRRVSECPSEDSYIVFDGSNDDLDDSDLEDLDSNLGEEDSEESEDECDIYWEGGNINETTTHQKQKTELTTKCPENSKPNKQVHFPADEHLVVVHRMVMWSFAYRASRKGPWEEYVRDRARFLRRIDCCRDSLNKILQKEHRERIFTERFRPELDKQQHNGNVKQSHTKTVSICGSTVGDDQEKRRHLPKRHKKRRNGKKRRKNRNRPKSRR